MTSRVKNLGQFECISRQLAIGESKVKVKKERGVLSVPGDEHGMIESVIPMKMFASTICRLRSINICYLLSILFMFRLMYCIFTLVFVLLTFYKQFCDWFV